MNFKKDRDIKQYRSEKYMLRILGNIITSKPWFVVIIIIIITIGFSVLLPTLEMQTSMDDFLPDDEADVRNHAGTDGAEHGVHYFQRQKHKRREIRKSKDKRSFYVKTWRERIRVETSSRLFTVPEVRLKNGRRIPRQLHL